MGPGGKFSRESSLAANSVRWGNRRATPQVMSMAKQQPEAHRLSPAATSQTGHPEFPTGTVTVTGQPVAPVFQVVTSSNVPPSSLEQEDVPQAASGTLQSAVLHYAALSSDAELPAAPVNVFGSGLDLLSDDTLKRRLREAKSILTNFVATHPRAMGQLSITGPYDLAQAILDAQTKDALKQHYLGLLRQRDDHRGRLGLLSALECYTADALSSTAFG